MRLCRCRRLRRALAALVVAVTATIAAVRSLWRARDVPFSPLTGGYRIGPEYPERAGITDGTEPAGEMDDMDAYARPGFDPDALHPEVRRFYERTSEYRMRYRARWHRGFRTGAALASRLTSRLEQLNLPGPDSEERDLTSRFVGIESDADPRDGARMWVRTDADGAGVFVAAYASHERDGERFVNIAVPLPASNLSTVLRPEELDCGHPDGAGIELTTRGGRDPGLYLVVPPRAFALPMGQRFRVWPADAPEAPTIDWADDPALVATHEMWVFGCRFLTVEYAIQASTSTS